MPVQLIPEVYDQQPSTLSGYFGDAPNHMTLASSTTTSVATAIGRGIDFPAPHQTNADQQQVQPLNLTSRRAIVTEPPVMLYQLHPPSPVPDSVNPKMRYVIRRVANAPQPAAGPASGEARVQQPAGKELQMAAP
ncbi:hypothetical protein QAD02_007759 [Eretmocerus hayati]|uniref:Uncharacterized protein n=1 Tax=Eretmocerus hayati TaxID=131215 RepID=A0ACC2N4U8_9HYME|nr:hypothetical protein QAD02_007759 [Eretmocerus hayati]